MNLIANQSITSNLETDLIVALDENNNIVYMNEAWEHHKIHDVVKVGHNFSDISTLTLEDLDKTDVVIKNKMIERLPIKWFITQVNGVKLLIQQQ